MGVCAKTELEAAKTTFPELRALVAAHEEREHREWERVRWQEWHQTIINPYIKRGNKPRTPKDLMQFPWETAEPERTPKINTTVTQAEIDCLIGIFEQVKRNNNG